ncbi:cupin domain-containing protein [Amycolatopsis magusensis]|uniref:Quercetin dioxygenase-like cupin family protein n=1 Tax=Amycolatopsis magusensis TaxID=882444 RepID=A0ABS4PX98_9PSEU|nr:cupin domain-containing protein [Amycolatopsis magusensis]MBP2184050.1 quercetin dioxygenase-like cupin family protein [Amycolatopsis magusensis]
MRVSEEELRRRTIRRSDFVSCNQAFIDCRTPGSDRKENYSMIGPGVTQSADQVVNLREAHGFNIGAAAMPNGITNNLHLHFTAEVFLCFRGEFLLRWGADGRDGELVLREGDIASLPTWIFRGFTNIGPDDGWLFTALGHDDTGGIIWGPSVLREAEGHGLYLTADNTLVDTVAGDERPPEDELVKPMTGEQIAGLRSYTPEQMRSKIATPEDLVWSREPFLDSRLPGGGAELALVIGYGMTEDPEQEPRIFKPHGHNIAWLRAEPGQGVRAHRHERTQVLMVKEGEWEVTLNLHDEVSVRLGPWDLLSVPAGAWRALRNVGEGTASMVVVNGGDGRVRLDWDDEVVKAAADEGVAIDHDGYLAPYALVPRPIG